MSTEQLFTQPPKQQLPPGMVLGPDGKPCKICTAFRNWKPPRTQAQVQGQSPASASTSNPSPSSKSAASSISAFSAFATAVIQPRTPGEDTRPAYCPPDVEQLGRATWTFLHTTAAYYPDRPDPNQQLRMRSLLTSLPTLYPCGHCASHLGEMMKKSPPDVSGRTALSLWLCQTHNEVNERLGKQKFDCAKVDERWKDGPADGGCD
ncbi:hypothetical protein M422DRAFT_151546 [Sphaerobolus stellatus SS14]|nr:hypothetical protein M422DRAFT_151546 [Sphaerobolus stellatus SS14]